MNNIFVDSSAWYALFNPEARHHRAVREVILERDGDVTTSNFVFDETVTLVASRMSHAAAVRVGDKLMSTAAVDLVRVGVEDEKEAWKLLCRRPDKGYSFTDCTSFVLMRRLKIEVAVSLDDHFRQEGFEVGP